MSEKDVHIYTSAKGSFLSWHEWVVSNCNEEEIFFYDKIEDTPEKLMLYKRWATDEQIIGHIIKHEDGTESDYGAPEGLE